MSIFANFFAVFVICVVVFYLGVFFKFAKECFISFKNLLDVTVLRNKKAKPGEFANLRMTKRLSSSKTARATADVTPRKPMAERIASEVDYSSYDAPTYLRHNIQLSF